MKRSLKEKTLSGMIWSFTEFSSNYFLGFIVSVVLARLLSPKEFGLVAALYVFENIAETFTDSGFRQSLIRKENCTKVDYSTVFYSNLVVSIICYILLFVFSSRIAFYFNQPQMALLMKVYLINIIIFAFNMVQVADAHKNVNFKIITKVTVISSVISGIIGIYMAFSGYGVWSLVFKALIGNIVKTIILWGYSSWRPALEFSITSFKEMFGFGSKLLVSDLLNRIYANVYKMIIVKYYSTEDLGYYDRAEKYRNLASINIKRTLERVTYPVFASLQNDNVLLKKTFIKTLKPASFIIFSLLFGLAASADSMIVALIGKQWVQSIIYLRILCIAGFVDILTTLNLNVIQAKGRSDLVLILNVIKKVITIPALITGIVFHNLELFVFAMTLTVVMSYFVNSYYTKKIINYPVLEQLRDVFPSFAIAMTMGVSMYMLGIVIKHYNLFNVYGLLASQIIFGALILFLLVNIFKLNEYYFLKRIVIDKYNKLKFGKG